MPNKLRRQYNHLYSQATEPKSQCFPIIREHIILTLDQWMQVNSWDADIYVIKVIIYLLERNYGNAIKAINAILLCNSLKMCKACYAYYWDDNKVSSSIKVLTFSNDWKSFRIKIIKQYSPMEN